MKGFPGGSDAREPACPAGGPGSAPGLGRSQLSLYLSIIYLSICPRFNPIYVHRHAFLQKIYMYIRIEGKATRSSNLAWRIPWTETKPLFLPLSLPPSAGFGRMYIYTHTHCTNECSFCGFSKSKSLLLIADTFLFS